MTSTLVQYIILRTDLKWPLGALIAQGCHASTAVNHLFQDHSDTKTYFSDLDNMHKIVLGIDSLEKLNNLVEKLKENNVDHKLWVEQPENIYTCLALRPYPKDAVQRFFKKLKLFNVKEDVDNNK